MMAIFMYYYSSPVRVVLVSGVHIISIFANSINEYLTTATNIEVGLHIVSRIKCVWTFTTFPVYSCAQNSDIMVKKIIIGICNGIHYPKGILYISII